MNRDDVLDLFDGVRSNYIVEAIESRDAVPKVKVRRRNFFLIAAVIAMTVLLVGCGIVYVLKMQDLKLGDQQVTQERWDEENKTVFYETVSQQVLTFSGLKGTPNYEAAREWYEFKKTYDPDWKIYHEQKDAGTLDYGPAEYSLYNCYTTEMWKKVEEIKDKYELKLQGKAVEAFNGESLYAYLGMDGVILEGAEAETDDIGVSYYDGGWFHTDMHMTLTDSPDWPYRFLCSLYYNPKNCFDTIVCELNDTADWQEWNYTTKSGDHLLIIRSPSAWFSWVFCDRGDATITLRIETIREVYSDDGTTQFSMTDDQLREVLDCIDFSIKPQPGDPALLEGPAASKALTQTQNGYTVMVKQVLTDGRRANILLGITAPEGTDLEQYLEMEQGGAYFSGISFTPDQNGDSIAGSMNYSALADSDGKANTIDVSVDLEELWEDGMAYAKGSLWKLYLENLLVKKWSQEHLQWQTQWEIDGTWIFEITMDDGDWREKEFVSQPITTKVCTGWDLNGNDVFRDVTVTSLKLRMFGGEYTSTWEHGQLDFADYKNQNYPTVVLKDGRNIPLRGDLALGDSNSILLNGDLTPEDTAKGIPLDEVVHLLLIDGTKLYPQT